MICTYAVNTDLVWDFVNTWGADAEYLYNAGYPYLRGALSDDFEIILPLIVR